MLLGATFSCIVQVLTVLMQSAINLAIFGRIKFFLFMSSYFEITLLYLLNGFSIERKN